jgi:hypothetical protein
VVGVAVVRACVVRGCGREWELTHLRERDGPVAHGLTDAARAHLQTTCKQHAYNMAQDSPFWTGLDMNTGELLPQAETQSCTFGELLPQARDSILYLWGALA